MRSLLTDDVAQTITCSRVATRFDYCNALLCGASEVTLDKLHRIQNNLLRVVCQRGGRADAGPLLWSLHWLPVRQRVTYNLQDGTDSPQVAGHSNADVPVPQRPGTHSCASTGTAVIRHSTNGVPRTKTNLARRAFSVAAPSIWNFLPAELRLCMEF